MTTEIEKIANLWKHEVYDRSSDYDPDNTQDWHSISLGYGIAHGLDRDGVWEFYKFISNKEWI